MNSIYDARERLKYLFIIVAVLIAIASVFVSDLLIKDLAREERQKIEVWAEATRRQYGHPSPAMQRPG